jgi:nuclear transport factor 2 (NTF2) superfamily protein
MKWEAEGKSATKKCEYWEYEGNPPDCRYCRPWKDEEATWFQVWETVSEGTPVTPPFATKEELIQYLADNGDFWDQRRAAEGTHRCHPTGWGYENAKKFVEEEWAPSAIMVAGKMYDASNLAEMPE